MGCDVMVSGVVLFVLFACVCYVFACDVSWNVVWRVVFCVSGCVCLLIWVCDVFVVYVVSLYGLFCDVLYLWV